MVQPGLKIAVQLCEGLIIMCTVNCVRQRKSECPQHWPSHMRICHTTLNTKYHFCFKRQRPLFLGDLYPLISRIVGKEMRFINMDWIIFVSFKLFFKKMFGTPNILLNLLEKEKFCENRTAMVLHYEIWLLLTYVKILWNI